MSIHKLTKSEVLAAYDMDERRRGYEKQFAEKTTSCFKCSRADPETVILDQSVKRQYVDEKIKVVYTLKFKCNILELKNRDFVLTCTSGDKKRVAKCSICKHAKEAMTAEYIKDTDDRAPMSEKHTLYRCSKNKEKGHYYRATYCCEEYKER